MDMNYSYGYSDLIRVDTTCSEYRRMLVHYIGQILAELSVWVMIFVRARSIGSLEIHLRRNQVDLAGTSLDKARPGIAILKYHSPEQ